MNLQVSYINVKDVVFGPETMFENGTLHINKGTLIDKIMDPRFTGIDVDLAFPGESCRIGSVGDIIQPTIKPDDEAATFPGVLGEMRQTGQGRTIKLRGLAVVETYDFKAPSGTFIDMSGPAAEHTQFSKTINLVLNPHPAEGVDNYNYAEALKKASLTAAVYLAKAAQDCVPDEIVNYSLDRENLADADGRALPRVAFIYQIFSHRKIIENLFYGDGGIKMLPTIVHPNEILDGALLNNDYEQLVNADPTYMIQNHPIVTELYRRHGIDLNFVGVVMSNTPSAMVDKERNSTLATGLAKHFLNAEAVIISKEGGGHPQVDIALCCDKSEAMGMKTQIVVAEFMTTSGKSDEAIVFNTPNANAIVTTGCLESFEVPAVERLLGNSIPEIKTPLKEAFMGSNRNTRGALSQLGDSWYTSIKY